jgi:hypothetical protein
MIESASPAKYDPAIQRAFTELHTHADFQFDLPEFKQPTLPSWLVALTRALRDDWIYIKWGLWAFAALVLIYVLYVLARRYWPLLTTRRLASEQQEHAGAGEWRPSPIAARKLLSESDALAAQGHYSEAVHLLLLRSIEDIQDRKPRLIRPTMTSREIGKLDPLPRSARAAFAGIAAAVERVRFAGQMIGVDEFLRCRRDYESFAFSPAWNSGAAP